MANYYEIQFYGEGHKKDFTFYLESANALSDKEVVEGLRESYLGVDGLETHHLDNVVDIISISPQEFTDGCGIEAQDFRHENRVNPVAEAKAFKMVSFTRERASERWSQTDYFLVEDSVENPEQAMRAAVAEFLTTADGEDMKNYTAGDYNWGDALASVPDSTWVKQGIHVQKASGSYNIKGSVVEITVNQDEVLMDETDEDDE